MAWLKLFERLILRPVFREPARTGLSVFAVVLGVAVVIAIELAGQAAAGSFRTSLETLVGNSDLEVSAVAGVPEEVVGTLARLPYPLEVSPRIDDYATVPGSGEAVTIVGLDLISSAAAAEALPSRPEEFLDSLRRRDSIWVTSKLGLKPGERLRLQINDRVREYVVRGIADLSKSATLAQDRVVVMDLPAAQEAVGREGRVDRIAITLPEGADLTAWESRIRESLPAGIQLSRQGSRTNENRRMLAAFRWNLRVLSYIALVVGAFIIYNTVAVSVVRRRTEIGILRALGATRGAVMAAFLLEALVYGIAGGVLGVLAGRLLAEAAVGLIGATVSSLYVSSTPGVLTLTPFAVLLGVCIGAGVSLVAALAPSREAASVAPVEAMARGRRDYDTRRNVNRDLVLALVLASCSVLSARMGPIGGKPVFGYIAALLLIAASALAVPGAVTLVTWMYHRLIGFRFGVEPMLGSRSLMASLGRSSILVGALSTAVAMMASVAIMVGSFRETVMVWMDNQLKADLYLRPASSGSADRHPTLSPNLAKRLASIQGVEAIDQFRALPISFRGLPATLGTGETDVIARFGRITFLPGHNRDEILKKLPTGDYAIISEPLANKHGLRAGDAITLPLGSQATAFRVLGVYYDYSNERGYVIVDRKVMERHLPGLAPSNLAIYVSTGFDVEAVRREVEHAIAGSSVLVSANRTLRSEALKIFDRTFAITYALEAVAILVAVLGVAGALLALVIDRRRELALLRFLGASAAQIKRLLLVEAGLLGLLAVATGFVLGSALSLILIFVINKQSFGWTIQFHWPVAILLSAFSLVFAATIAAGLYPARIATRMNPIEVVHEE